MQGCREWGGHATRGDPTAARWQATSIGLQDPRWCHDVCRTLAMPGPRRWQGNQAPRRPPCRHWPAEQPCRQNTGVLGVRGGVSCWALPHHGGWWWWSGRGRPPVGWVHAKKKLVSDRKKKGKKTGTIPPSSHMTCPQCPYLHAFPTQSANFAKTTTKRHQVTISDRVPACGRLSLKAPLLPSGTGRAQLSV